MKSKKFVRGLSMWMALLLLVSSVAVLASCGGDTSVDESATESASGTTDTEANAYQQLEKTKYDRNLKLYAIDDSVSDFMPDESEKGETLTDEMILRNYRMKEDFGVEIEVVEGGGYLDVIESVNKQIKGNMDDYDLYAGQLHNFKNNALQNQCMNLNEVEYIDLEQPWWDANCRDTLVMDGDKNFMMTGNISAQVMLASSCMAFNKQLMADLKKTDPYDLVYDGEWTLDQLYEYTNGVTNPQALDGAGRYGMTGWSLHAAYSLFYGAGECFVTFEEDTPVIDYNSKKVIDIYEKIYKIIVTANAHYIYKDQEYNDIAKGNGSLVSVFTEGRALFVNTDLGGVSASLTSMEDDYGVVPMPKYDVAQEEYLSFINGGSPLFFILNTEKDDSFVGHMMEALATYNYEYVASKIVDVVAKSKDVRDPESADMVDYIMATRVYDFAYYARLDLADVVIRGLDQKNESIASQFTLAKKSSEKGLTSLLKSWQNIMDKENKK